MCALSYSRSAALAAAVAASAAAHPAAESSPTRRRPPASLTVTTPRPPRSGSSCARRRKAAPSSSSAAGGRRAACSSTRGRTLRGRGRHVLLHGVVRAAAEGDVPVARALARGRGPRRSSSPCAGSGARDARRRAWSLDLAGRSTRDWEPEASPGSAVTSTCVESGGEVAVLDPLAPREAGAEDGSGLGSTQARADPGRDPQA